MHTSTLTGIKSLNHTTWLLLIFLIFARMGLFISIPYLTFFLSYLHFSKLNIGILVAMQPIAYSFGCLFLGFLGDKFGKKKIMIISNFAMAITSFGMANVSTFLGYFILNSLLGVSRSLFDSAMPAYLTDITPIESHRLVFNLRFIVINLASAIGPLIGVYFAAKHSSFVFTLSAIIYLICAISMIKPLPKDKIKKSLETQSQKSNIFSYLIKDKALLAITIGTMIFYLVYIQLESPLAQVLLMRYPHDAAWLFGMLWVLNAVIIVLFQMPLTMLTERFSIKTTTFCGVIILMISFFSLALYINKISLIISIILLTISEMLISPLSSIVIAKISPEHLRSTYFGALTFSSIGVGLAPLIGNVILQFGNSQILFFVMALLSIGVYICYRYCFHAMQSEHDSSTDPESKLIENI